MPGGLPTTSSTAAVQGVPPPDNGVLGQSSPQHKRDSATRTSGHPYATPSPNYDQRASYGVGNTATGGEEFRHRASEPQAQQPIAAGQQGHMAAGQQHEIAASVGTRKGFGSKLVNFLTCRCT